MSLYINNCASLVVVFLIVESVTKFHVKIISEGIDKEILNTFPFLGIEAENCCLLLLMGALLLQCLFENFPSVFILKRRDANPLQKAVSLLIDILCFHAVDKIK